MLVCVLITQIHWNRQQKKPRQRLFRWISAAKEIKKGLGIRVNGQGLGLVLQKEHAFLSQSVNPRCRIGNLLLKMSELLIGACSSFWPDTNSATWLITWTRERHSDVLVQVQSPIKHSWLDSKMVVTPLASPQSCILFFPTFHSSFLSSYLFSVQKHKEQWLFMEIWVRKLMGR